MLNTVLPESSTEFLSAPRMVASGRIDGLSIFNSPTAEPKQVITFPIVQNKAPIVYNSSEKDFLGTKSRLSQETVSIVPSNVNDDWGASFCNEKTQPDMDDA